jgi:hypothetical protein
VRTIDDMQVLRCVYLQRCDINGSAERVKSTRTD